MRVRNDYDFRGLDFVEVAWDVTEDGRIVREGRLKAPALEPKQEGELLIPLQRPAPKPGAESFLNVRYVLKLRRSAEMTHLCSPKVDHPRSVPARSCGGGWGPALEAPRRAPLALRPKAGVQSAVVPIVVPGVLARATAAGHF